MFTYLKPTFIVILSLAHTIGVISQPNNAFIAQSDLIFPLQEKHVHGSSIVELPNGDLLTCWFYGSGERKSDDVKIMGSRLKNGSKKWSDPFELADTPGLPDCNPVLFLNDKNVLFLVWIAVQANQWENSILRVRTSQNYLGNDAPEWTWQDNILLKPGDEFAMEVERKLKMLPETGAGWAAYAPEYDKMIIEASGNLLYRSLGWMTRLPPLQTDGKILLPLYSDGLNMSLVAISEDEGNTWRASLPIVGRGPIQPALVQKEDKSIVAFMRDSGDKPSRVQISTSTDGGESWSPATKSDIPNTATAVVLSLKNGDWVFVGNDIDDGRYQLSIWISDDEGDSWKWKEKLENVPPGKGSFSYPCVIKDKGDEYLHITYSYHLGKRERSIKYIKVDVSKIKN